MCGQPCPMSEHWTRRLMSEQQPSHLTSEWQTIRHLHSKVNVNQLLHTISKIGKLNGQSTT